jgi:serine/tyrosine/threonine adenylyltransferase
MPLSTNYRPDARLIASGLDLFDRVNSADFPEATLRYRNDRAAKSIGLEGLSDTEWVDHFARFAPLPGNQAEPIALRYHGHQFRHYNPDLGDGRGFLFAQMHDDQGRLLDLGTKGSGTTPRSRGGDGRLTLKGGVREILATAMLEALGVPTSKSLSLIETGEALHRGDEPSPTRSAVLVRLSHSHIRFGTFQRLAYLGDKATMEGLTGYVAATYFPDITAVTSTERVTEVFDRALRNSAYLVAKWMAAGFVHGVLNTDNMNITGESFDYGPYRFLPHYDPAFTAAYFDETRLYAYGRQPDAVYWNLAQLGQSLALIGDPEALQACFKTFEDHYRRELADAMCARLNLIPQGVDADTDLIAALFALLDTLHFDGSYEGTFYDWFGGMLSKDRAMASPRAKHYAGPAFDAFYAALETYSCAAPAKLAHPRFLQPDPETLLITEIEHLWTCVNLAHEWDRLDAKLAAIAEYGEALSLG